MPISYIDVHVKCPFYQYSKGQERKICCEGIIEGSSTFLVFHRRNDFRIQMEVFCCEHYAKCEVYNMLMTAKYSDD